MEQKLPEARQRFRSLAFVVNLSNALDDLKVTRTGAELQVEGRIPQMQVRIALDLAMRFVPHPPVPVPVPIGDPK
jgi:hypothetical protein